MEEPFKWLAKKKGKKHTRFKPKKWFAYIKDIEEDRSILQTFDFQRLEAPFKLLANINANEIKPKKRFVYKKTWKKTDLFEISEKL